MNKGKDVILVTGATGRQGAATARHLLFHGHRVRIMTRKPQDERAKALAQLGAEVVQGDFDDQPSIDRALTGVWGAFAIQNTWEAGVVREEEQGKRFAESAKKKGVQHFVYTSVASAHRNTGIPHFENKWRIEKTVRALRFPSYTILRPTFFMDNWESPWFKPGLQDGKLAIGMHRDTRLQMIAVDDIGLFGSLAFEQHAQMNGREIDLAGDQVTMPEAAEILSKVAGRKIEFVQVPIDAVRKMSEDFATMLEWFDRVGYDAQIAALALDYRVKLTSFAEWAQISKGWR